MRVIGYASVVQAAGVLPPRPRHMAPRPHSNRVRHATGVAAWFAVVASLPAMAVAQQSGPPPSTAHYLQYGVALVAETVPSAGGVCPAEATAPCVLGPGIGFAARIGYRTRGPWYVGGAYEFSRQDSSNLLRLAILQQARAEARLYGDRSNRLVPYAAGGAGLALYGNEWGAETVGITGLLGIGVELQVTPLAAVGATIGYRPTLFRVWTDGAGQTRANDALGFGLAHLVGVEFTLEIRSALPRW